jgi:hypothetical protein
MANAHFLIYVHIEKICGLKYAEIKMYNATHKLLAIKKM